MLFVVLMYLFTVHREIKALLETVALTSGHPCLIFLVDTLLVVHRLS